MNGLAVYAVLYPAAMRFLGEFWSSLAPQISPHDSVYFSLDGVPADDVRSITGRHPSLRFLPVAPGASPATIRSEALAYLTQAHEQLVLLDADDILLPGRLTMSVRALERVDVYGAAMQVVNESGAPIQGATFAPSPAQVEAIESHSPLLARVNMFGFSNSAYRATVLRACLPVPHDTVMMDWLVASRAYLAGATFAFDLEPRMLYRQYGANTATVLPPFGPARIVSDAARVADHHAKLFAGPYASERDFSPFARARERSAGFAQWLLAGPAVADGPRRPHDYAAKLAEVARRTWLWWEHVAAEKRGDGYEPPYHV